MDEIDPAITAPVLILGAGGHGRVVADILLAAGRPVAGFLDDRVAGPVAGLPVLGPFARALDPGFGRGRALIVALGDTGRRVDLSRAILRAGAALATAIHPFAVLAGGAQVGAGCSVSAAAVIGTGATVGRFCIVNTAAVVDHDCALGDGAFLGPGVRLCGGVVVGARAVLGAGAVVLPGVRIAAGSRVRAGTVVDVDFGPG
ncbi:NeuD/PglB/VioB family sugar acetyltransferase [Elioraea sp.]|uniref:NeuD/PglB/VioB family sugar acetyltransferase n=1 Tax=Elioraea sp. TaxID=2185103 RepID=UPI003F71FDBE